MRALRLAVALASAIVATLVATDWVNRASVPPTRDPAERTLSTHPRQRHAGGTYTYAWGPIRTGDYVTHWVDRRAPHPQVDGFVTRVHAQLVDAATGRPISMATAMLHHFYLTRLRRGRQGAGCTGRPSAVFYSTGEEDETLRLPAGYGYRLRPHDRWRLTAMIMSHAEAPAKVKIQYTVTVSRDRSLIPVDPFWLRANGCERHVAYPVPGGGPRGARYVRTFTWRVPFSGRIVAASGHLHGGALKMWLAQPRCGGRRLLDTDPRYAMPGDLRYHLHPVLHEPGPADTRMFVSGSGVPVRAGETIELKAAYDDHHPHWAVMAVMHIYLARARGVPHSCAPLPRDRRELVKPGPARGAPPFVRVPLSRLDAHGRPRAVRGVLGPAQRFGSGARVSVAGSGFSVPHLSLPAGATLTWRFPEPILHDVTFASGPRAAGSLLAEDGAATTVRLRIPGRYRFFCSLHPMTMHEVVDVRRG
jgi:plastocyanin